MDLCVLEWNVCRVCLREEGDSNSKHCSAFKKASKNDNNENLTIAELLMACSKVIISKNINLPNKLCKSCLEDLYVAYRFHKNCEHSNTVLNAIVPDSSDSKIKTDDSFDKSDDASSLHNKLNVVKTEEFKIDDENSEENDTTFDYNNVEVEIYDEEIPSSNEIEYVSIENELNDKKDETLIENTNDMSTTSVTEEDVMNAPKIIVLVPKDQPIKRVAKKLSGSLPTEENRVKRRYRKKADLSNIELTCAICGSEYKFPQDLERHIKRHTNDKQFMCSECGKAFVSNSELTRHSRTHTGQKPYPCKYCGRAFSDFGSRMKHERTHTGERPFCCEICHKQFAYSHVLSNHMLTHTGEKRYECPKCGRKCTKAHHLKNHLATHAKHEAMESQDLKRRNVPSLMNNTFS